MGNDRKVYNKVSRQHGRHIAAHNLQKEETKMNYFENCKTEEEIKNMTGDDSSLS